MNFRENDLELVGNEGEDLDYENFATATVGPVDGISRRDVTDPYFSLYLVQDYTYI